MTNSVESSRKHDQQTWNLYRRDFSAEVVHAYEEARSRGFGDVEMEMFIYVPTQMQDGPPAVLPTIAARLKVIALRMGAARECHGV